MGHPCALHTFLKGEHGFASSKQTGRLIAKIKEYAPDIIHLHNIHGFYLDVEQLFWYSERLREAGGLDPSRLLELHRATAPISTISAA